MKSLAATLTALMLLTLPAAAQTMTVLLPSLDWPTDEVTTSTKGCAPAEGKAVCTLTE